MITWVTCLQQSEHTVSDRLSSLFLNKLFVAQNSWWIFSTASFYMHQSLIYSPPTPTYKVQNMKFRLLVPWNIKYLHDLIEIQNI